MKTLSSVLLILNPISGFFMVVCVGTGGLWWFGLIPLILVVFATLKFYCSQHAEEFAKQKAEYDRKTKLLEQTHVYVGMAYRYHDDPVEIWENIKTGEYIER